MPAQKCPVCEGKGKVNSDFYPDLKNTTTTVGWINCRGCNGTGVVFSGQETYMPYIPSNPMPSPWHNPWEKIPPNTPYWQDPPITICTCPVNKHFTSGYLQHY